MEGQQPNFEMAKILRYSALLKKTCGMLCYTIVPPETNMAPEK